MTIICSVRIYNLVSCRKVAKVYVSLLALFLVAGSTDIAWIQKFLIAILTFNPQYER